METLIAIVLAGVLAYFGLSPTTQQNSGDLAAPTGAVVVEPLSSNASAGNGGMYVYATLANKGTVEYALAPLYTRTMLIAETVKRKAKDGRLPLNIAETAIAQCDSALEKIRQARLEVNRDVFDARVAQASDLLDRADALLKEYGR